MQLIKTKQAKWNWHKKTYLGVIMSIKVFFSVMISTLATTAIAAVDCKPYKQEAIVKEQIVADFGYELEKIEKKVIALEKKISKKLSKMDNLQVGIE